MDGRDEGRMQRGFWQELKTMRHTGLVKDRSLLGWEDIALIKVVRIWQIKAPDDQVKKLISDKQGIFFKCKYVMCNVCDTLYFKIICCVPESQVHWTSVFYRAILA